MDLLLLAQVLQRRRALQAHDRWSREQLSRHQAQAQHRLRTFAAQHSPFYRRFHRGLDHRPWHELPVLTKNALMEHFDDLVTDRTVRLDDVRAYMAQSGGQGLFRGRYQVNATGGSTGQPGLFLYTRDEWAWVMASYARMYAWSGVQADILHRPRLAVVSTTHPWHQSARVGLSAQGALIPTLRLDAARPLDDLIAELNAWQPQALVAYAGVADRLAQAQVEGSLRIQPDAVLVASEVLTDAARNRIHGAWGRLPFNEYGATETAGIAGECRHHHGLHLYEDLLVVEAVDDDHHPVRPGEVSARLLVSVLFSRTQPLIRYELSDRVQLATDTCACGMPYRRINAIQGRAEDVLSLPGPGGPVEVHPNVFHDVLETAPVAQWQVVQDVDSLRVLVVAPEPQFDPVALHAQLTRALTRLGVIAPSVEVQVVSAIPHTAVGKTPLIRALSRTTRGTGPAGAP